jgi:hypothetical protein
MRYHQHHLKVLLHAAFVVLTTLCLMRPAWAVATLTVVNNDGPGEGFNDPTPFTSTGGNPATSLGDARLIAFQFAANLWGSMVNSLVEIRIEAQFDPLPCNPTQGVLGTAGANTVFRDFVNTPLAMTSVPRLVARSMGCPVVWVV